LGSKVVARAHAVAGKQTGPLSWKGSIDGSVATVNVRKLDYVTVPPTLKLDKVAIRSEEKFEVHMALECCPGV
jgi:hypothetical protein